MGNPETEPSLKAQGIATRAPLGRVVGVLAIPTLFAQVAQTFSWLGEIYFVSHLGDRATAAVGAVGQLGMLLMVLTMMVSTSTTTLIAQKWGGNDIQGARRVAASALQQGFLFGLLAWLIWPTRIYVWSFLRLSPPVAGSADTYLVGALAAALPFSLSFALMALFRGIGDMVTPLISVLIAVFSHLSLAALLVPLWGLWGAGIALFLSRLFSLIYLWRRLHNSPLSASFSLLKERDRAVHRDLLRLGLPAGAGALSMSLAQTAYFAIISRSPHPLIAQAALTAGMRIEALAFMPGIAFSITAQTLVGQNIGAGQWDRARQAAWQTAGYCILIMTSIAAVFFLFAGPIAETFTRDSATARAIASYLRINALSEPFLALGMAIGGALRGAGDTFSPALIGIFSLWIARMPLAYWLCAVARKDVEAAWWVMSLSTVLSGVLTGLVFHLRQRKLARPIAGARSGRGD